MKINQPLFQCQPNLGNNLNGHPVIYLQMDWVCGDAWRGPFTQSMAFLGAVVGALVFGRGACTYNVLVFFGIFYPLPLSDIS